MLNLGSQMTDKRANSIVLGNIQRIHISLLDKEILKNRNFLAKRARTRASNLQ